MKIQAKLKKMRQSRDELLRLARSAAYATGEAAIAQAAADEKHAQLERALRAHEDFVRKLDKQPVK